MAIKRQILCGILTALAPVFSGAAGKPQPQTITPSPVPLIRNYGLVPLPPCKDNKGRDVTYMPGTTKDLKDMGGFNFGAALIHKNKPIIVYDKDILPSTHPTFQNQVLYHECAHHRLGHIDVDTALSALTKTLAEYEAKIIEKETHADCDAIRSLRDTMQYGAAEIDIIGKTLAHYVPWTADPKIKGTLNDRTVVLKLCLG